MAKRVIDLDELTRSLERECGYGGLEPRRLSQLMPERRGGHRIQASKRRSLSEYGPGTHWVAQVYAERTGQE